MSAPLASKQFAGGYIAEIEPNVDRPGVDCHVRKGNYQASLGCLEGEGILWWNGPGAKEDHQVPSGIIDEIAEWAQGHGY